MPYLVLDTKPAFEGKKPGTIVRAEGGHIQCGVHFKQLRRITETEAAAKEAQIAEAQEALRQAQTSGVNEGQSAQEALAQAKKTLQVARTAHTKANSALVNDPSNAELQAKVEEAAEAVAEAEAVVDELEAQV